MVLRIIFGIIILIIMLANYLDQRSLKHIETLIYAKVLIDQCLAKFLLCWRLQKPEFFPKDQRVHLARKEFSTLPPCIP